jgi:aldose 1-epimerase
VTWQAEAIGDAAVEACATAVLTATRASGNLDARVVYRLDGAALRIECRATSDAPTVVSREPRVLESRRRRRDADPPITASRSPRSATRRSMRSGFRPARSMAVAGTPFDSGRRAASASGCPTPAASTTTSRSTATARAAAHLEAARSGRVLALATTLPGLQLYTGSCFDGAQRFRGGVATPRFGAVALEAQHFPNAPNEAGFPSALLRPGSVYDHTTVYAFAWH